MRINGAEPSQEPAERGHVLLLAGTAEGRRTRQIRVVENLHALTAVSIPALLRSTVPADMVQLADSAEPQSVLTRLHAAAAAPGPLLIYVTGRLTADRRRHQPHLALARTTPHSVRYTALPWDWLRDVLHHRRYPTVVLADLSADKSVWHQLRADRSVLTSGLPLYGVVTPPDAGPAEPGPTDYTRRLAELLRISPVHLGIDRIHQSAARHAALPGETLLLPESGPGSRPPDRPATPAAVPSRSSGPRSFSDAPAPDPHQAIRQAANAGRHTEAAAMAAAWEQYALRTHGPGSAEVRHWLEVRADLARLADDPARAAELWLAVARAHLACEGAEAPRLLAALDNAHHCWEHITDSARARGLGPELIALRREAPGPGGRSLRAARRRLERLRSSADPSFRAEPSAPG